jgi:synaptobrevin family protein YKT6
MSIQYKTNLDFTPIISRHSIKELLHEFVISAAESLNDPERKIFEHNEFQILCHRQSNDVVIIVTDHEYPSRVAFDIIKNIFHCPTDNNLIQIMQTRQDGLDTLSRIKSSLEETMVIAHENVNRVIQRGEDIDKLVEKSQRLSATSKTFYKVAKKHNRCCAIT